jgi:hypothetical protein
MSWSRSFHVSTPLPQIAAERLLEAVEGKSLIFAEAAIRKAVNVGKPPPEPTPRRKVAKR